MHRPGEAAGRSADSPRPAWPCGPPATPPRILRRPAASTSRRCQGGNVCLLAHVTHVCLRHPAWHELTQQVCFVKQGLQHGGGIDCSQLQCRLVELVVEARRSLPPSRGASADTGGLAGNIALSSGTHGQNPMSLAPWTYLMRSLSRGHAVEQRHPPAGSALSAEEATATCTTQVITRCRRVLRWACGCAASWALGAGSRCVQEIDPAAVGPAAVAHLLTAMVRTALVLVKPITARLNSL